MRKDAWDHVEAAVYRMATIAFELAQAHGGTMALVAHSLLAEGLGTGE